LQALLSCAAARTIQFDQISSRANYGNGGFVPPFLLVEELPLACPLLTQSGHSRTLREFAGLADVVPFSIPSTEYWLGSVVSLRRLPSLRRLSIPPILLHAASLWVRSLAPKRLIRGGGGGSSSLAHESRSSSAIAFMMEEKVTGKGVPGRWRSTGSESTAWASDAPRCQNRPLFFGFY
jgi:hypothetical protein